MPGVLAVATSTGGHDHARARRLDTGDHHRDSAYPFGVGGMTASAGQSVLPISEPQTYLVGPGFFAHLWRDRYSAQAWNERSAQFRTFEEVILKARSDGDEHSLKDALVARRDLTAELVTKYGRQIRQRCYRTDRLSWLVKDGVDAATDNWVSQGIFRRGPAFYRR
jgi:hypothetical protein